MDTKSVLNQIEIEIEMEIEMEMEIEIEPSQTFNCVHKWANGSSFIILFSLEAVLEAAASADLDLHNSKPFFSMNASTHENKLGNKVLF